MTDLNVIVVRCLPTPIAELEPGFFWTKMTQIGAEGEVITQAERDARLEAARTRLFEAEVGTPYHS